MKQFPPKHPKKAPPKNIGDVAAYEVWTDFSGDATWHDGKNVLVASLHGGEVWVRDGKSPSDVPLPTDSQYLGIVAGILLDEGGAA